MEALTAIAARLLGKAAISEPTVAKALAQQAIALIEAAEAIAIHAHEGDYRMLRDGAADMLVELVGEG